jgi:hypothetical protein
MAQSRHRTGFVQKTLPQRSDRLSLMIQPFDGHETAQTAVAGEVDNPMPPLPILL